jgi:predicted PurR-regulated permease PerM
MRRIGRSLAAGPFFTLAFTALVFLCLAATRDYVVPIAIAVLVWFLLNGIADALRRHVSWLPRRVAQLISAAILFVLVLSATRVLVANLAELAAGLSVQDSPLLTQLRAGMDRLGFDGFLTREALLERFALEDWIAYALGVARGFVSDVALVFLYTMFLLIDERFYQAKLRALVPDPSRRARLEATLAEIGGETRLYLWLMTLVSAGVGLVTWAACLGAGVTGAGFWGFLAFGLNFIPTIGSILAVALPGVFAVMTLADPAALLVLLAVLAATQFVAGEIVVPRIMGDSLNLSSTVILLTLVAWGAVWGPAGMFLAIPITVILVMVFAKFEATRPIAVILSKTGDVPPAEHPPARPAATAPRAEAQPGE